MENITLKDCFIGLPDGETEAQNEKFEELFYNSNNIYTEIMSNKSIFLVIGRKGTGKTYLANYINKKAKKNERCYIINSQEYWIDKLINLDAESNSEGYVFALCKWFILKIISKKLLENSKIITPFTKKKKLKKFIEFYDNTEYFKELNTISNQTAQISNSKSSTLKIDQISNEANKGLQFGINKSVEAKRKYFYEQLNAYEKLVFKILKKNKKSLILIFDDLDELDKKLVQNPSQNDIILNLIKIVKDYNNKFIEMKKNVRIILLVRTDIISKLQLYDNNLNKITSSCGVELYWLTNCEVAPDEHPLMNMVLHKIKTSCPSFANISNKELYTKLFPENIDGKKPLNYLLDYSFGRPRDIVTYLNEVMRYYPQSSFFSALALKDVRKYYASKFYNELVNEVYFHEDTKYTQACINLVSGLKKTSFNVKTVYTYFEENLSVFSEISNVNEALNFLYQIGAIGNVWSQGAGNFHSAWSYKKESMDDIDITKKMTIHYALRKKFSI